MTKIRHWYLIEGKTGQSFWTKELILDNFELRIEYIFQYCYFPKIFNIQDYDIALSRRSNDIIERLVEILVHWSNKFGQCTWRVVKVKFR